MGIKKIAAGVLLALFTTVAGSDAMLRQQPTEPVPPLPPVSAPATSVRPTSAQAEAMKYESATYLAYVVTGSALVNSTSQKGLEALSDMLNQRTAIEPAGVVPIDIENDDITLLPFIYWPITQDAPALSEKAQQKVQSYLNKGGFILFDIRDQDSNETDSKALQRVLGGVSIKPLRQMPPDHTLTRTFYLLSTLRGSSDYGAVWVEEPGAKGTESVSSVIIGENNWAGGWAGTFLSANSRDREMALRAGVNMVMYAMMGEYKGDQLQVKEILKRIGGPQ